MNAEDYFNITREQLEAMGWPAWSEIAGLRLCPAREFDKLPNGIAMWSISGAVKVKGRDYIDDDTRGGCIAYGLIPGLTRTAQSAAEVAAAEAVRRADFVNMLAEACRETGVIDAATGRLLTGDDAEQAIRSVAGE